MNEVQVCTICQTPYVLRQIPLTGTKIRTQGCDCDIHGMEERTRITRELVERSDIPAKFRVSHIDDWRHVEGTESAFQAVNEYISKLPENFAQGAGMLLTGRAGVGKTKLSSYVGMRYMIEMQKPVYFISLTRFVQTLDSMRKNRESYEKYTRKYHVCPILIIDDVGESNIEPWNRGMVFDLFDSRNDGKKVTIFSTMNDYKTQCEHIGEHNVSRMLEMAGRNKLQITSNKDMRRYL